MSGTGVVIVCLSEGTLDLGGDMLEGVRVALDEAEAQPASTILLISLKLGECENQGCGAALRR